MGDTDSSDPAATGIAVEDPSNGPLGLGPDDPGPGPRSTITGFVLEARDIDGVLIAALPNIFVGKWKEKWNQPDELNFSYPAQAAEAASIIGAAKVWLWDDAGNVLNKFEVDTYTDVQQDAQTCIEFQCYDGLLGLADATVDAQETLDDDGFPGRTLFAGFMADIVARGGLFWGGIIGEQYSIAETHQIRIDRPQPLQHVVANVIKRLPHRYVRVAMQPATDSIVIRVEADAPAEQCIMYGGNLKGIKRTVKLKGRVNQIHMYGEGQDPASQLKVTVEGEAPVTRALVMSDPSISDPAELLAAANAALIKENVEKVSFEVDVANVAISNPDFAESNLLSLEVGRKTIMRHQLLGIEDEVMVTEIEHSLLNLLDIKLQLDAAPAGLPDVFESLLTGAGQASKGPMRVANDDGSRYPFIARMFLAANENAVEALPAANPGLSFRDGDYAFFEGQSGNRPLRLRDASQWVQIAGTAGNADFTIWTAANLTALTALITSEGITAPALGQTEDDEKYYKLVDGAWVEIGTAGNAGFSIWTAANLTALTALITSEGIEEPAVGHTADYDGYYRLIGGKWGPIDSIWKAANLTALTALITSESLASPWLGWVADTGIYYKLVDGAWVQIGGGAGLEIWTAANKTALTALIASEGITAPAFGWTADTRRYYDLGDGGWDAWSFLE